MVDYINLGILLVTLGFVIGVYVHTDKKIDKLSDEIREVDNKLSAIIERLSDRIDKLSDRMDRIYDILVHMGFRDKAANE